MWKGRQKHPFSTRGDWRVVGARLLKKIHSIPTHPDWVCNILAALILVISAAFILPYVVESWGESIRTDEDWERYMRSPALASFPIEIEPSSLLLLESMDSCIAKNGTP